jgi:hypothetical protein
MIVALAGPSKSGKTVVVEKVVGRDTLIPVQGTRIEGADDVWDRVLYWMETPAQRGAQIAFENYRARLNRIFDVGSDELYKPKQAV